MQFEGFQKARAGLASGHAPKLASAGTGATALNFLRSLCTLLDKFEAVILWAGGSYFISDDAGNNVAVFKPEDEEPLAKNNPRGNHGGSLDGNGLRKGIRPGEGAVREVEYFILKILSLSLDIPLTKLWKTQVAAFVLDNHFAGVPPTALVTCQEKITRAGVQEAKVGSLQVRV